MASPATSDIPALNDNQRFQLWELWIGAAARSLYFSKLANRFARAQNVIQGTTLFFSGSAVAALFFDPQVARVLPSIASYLPAVKLGLPLVTGAFNVAGLVKQYTKRSYECSELYQKWGKLELSCQRLWNSMYQSDAATTLAQLQDHAFDISTPSTRSMPDKRRLMGWCQDEATQKIQASLGVTHGN